MLYKIADELHKHHRERNELMEMYIRDRLDITVDTYANELLESYRYLEKTNSNNLMNRLTRGD